MNSGHIKHMAQVRQLYSPNMGTLTDNLPSMGDSLKAAANELARDCTLERVDSFLDRLQAAMNLTVHIRKAIAGERVSTVQSSGTG